LKHILIVGATSAIAMSCAEMWAHKGAELFLVARNKDKLDMLKSDLEIRGAKKVTVHSMDITDYAGHEIMLNNCIKVMPKLDIAFIATGTLPNQSACEKDVSMMLKEVGVNANSVMALLTILANYFELQRSGCIAVITSVAGDRGRPSNYVYGSAKASLSTFCGGLRVRMYNVGINVLDIRPGFVDTPMTQNLELPPILLSSPKKVASLILKGIERNTGVVYVPGYWRFIMMVIKLLPQFIFRKIDL